jgi:hypothetical protein
MLYLYNISKFREYVCVNSDFLVIVQKLKAELNQKKAIMLEADFRISADLSFVNAVLSVIELWD